MKPLFSIVVPVYNVEKYLQRCLDSIVNQTFKNFECILVNDGSTDGSTEIVNYYAKEYGFLKAIHQSNKGLSAARNKGIENCSGEYILFCDSDDFVEKEMLESCYKKICEDDYPDVIVFGYKELNKNNTKIINYEETDVTTIRKNYLTELWGTSVCNKCFKRNLFEGCLFPVGLLYEDYWILPKLLFKANSIRIINKAFYNYDRTIASSISRQLDSKHRYFKFKAKLENEIFALSNCVEVYHALERKTVAEDRRCIFKYYFDNILDISRVEEIKEYLRSKSLTGKEKFWIDRILNNDILICKIYAKIRGYC